MLSHRIAAGYAGFNASAPALELIAARGAAWALAGAPDRLPFLQVGADCWVGRVWFACVCMHDNARAHACMRVQVYGIMWVKECALLSRAT